MRLPAFRNPSSRIRNGLKQSLLLLNHSDPFLHGADAAPELGMAFAETELLDDLLAATPGGVLNGEGFLGSFALGWGGVEIPIVVRQSKAIHAKLHCGDRLRDDRPRTHVYRVGHTIAIAVGGHIQREVRDGVVEATLQAARPDEMVGDTVNATLIEGVKLKLVTVTIVPPRVVVPVGDTVETEMLPGVVPLKNSVIPTGFVNSDPALSFPNKVNV